MTWNGVFINKNMGEKRKKRKKRKQRKRDRGMVEGKKLRRGNGERGQEWKHKMKQERDKSG